MRLVFAGTPPFACPTLVALVESGFTVVAVLTQPDRPAGRGRKLTKSAVRLQAEALQIPVLTPVDSAQAEVAIKDLRPDVVVVVAYGLLLPPGLLAIPQHGCINIHASLLPRWRGAAPIARAIEAGDLETGITIMQMDEGLDTGPMLARISTPISDEDTAITLGLRLSTLGVQALMPVLADLRSHQERPAIAQPAQGALYARKLRKEEARIDWTRPALALERQVRAFLPWPGTSTTIQGLTVKIGAARACRSPNGPPGEVLQTKPALVVGTGLGALTLNALQAPNGRMQPAASFLTAHTIHVGETIG